MGDKEGGNGGRVINGDKGVGGGWERGVSVRSVMSERGGGNVDSV